MHTFAELRTRVLRFLDEATNTQTSMTNLVNDALNASHTRVLLSRSWPFLRWPREETLTTVASTRVYALNHNVSRLVHLWDTTARSFVPLIPYRNWENLSVDRTETVSQPPGAVYGAWWPVAVQPSTPTTLTIQSSSSSDTTGKTVTLRGFNTNGALISESITANGTSTVASTNSYAHLLNVTKGGTWVGTMTLKESSTTLLTLLAAEEAKQYPTLEFVETPSAARTYTYAFQRTPRQLSADNDIPETPFPFSEIHVYDALLDLTNYNTEATTPEQMLWRMRRDDLYKQLCEFTDHTAAIGASPRFVRDTDAQLTRRVTIFP